tara:strand:+ start:63 stop:236 length:174 start_codon:yes stop_codon:yes gene_type:complete
MRDIYLIRKQTFVGGGLKTTGIPYRFKQEIKDLRNTRRQFSTSSQDIVNNMRSFLKR